jgi:hypothetical protein
VRQATQEGQKAPSTKHQIPNKDQETNGKFQTGTKHQTADAKFLHGALFRTSSFGICRIFVWSLLGIWCLLFGAYPCLGACYLELIRDLVIVIWNLSLPPGPCL